MSVIERSWRPATTAQGRLSEKRKKQMLGAASILLLFLLAVQVPKTLRQLEGSTSAASAPAVAAPAASAGSPVRTTPAARRTARLLRNLPAKDPFVPGIRMAPAGNSSAPTPVLSSPSGSTSSPSGSTSAGSPTPFSAGVSRPAVPAVAPTAARLRVNGQVLTAAVGQAFPAAAPVFRLTSLTRRAAKISVVGGAFESGAKTITVSRGHAVTLVNQATGVRYVVSFQAPGAAKTSSPAAPSTSSPPTAPSATVDLPPPSTAGN